MSPAENLRGPLEGTWIEIFRAGNYGDRGAWSPEDLDRLAASYNPRLQAAPVVLGHPADDAPAYGWVRGLRRAGASLWAQLEKVDPAFEALLRAGRFAQRSVALYTHFPPTGGPYLRHLGFLGAAPPAVKALAPIRFVDAPSVTVEFISDPSLSQENAMPEAKSTLENFLAHLRSFFTPDPSPASVIPSPAAQDERSAFSERLAALEQRLDSLAAEKQAPEPVASDAGPSRRREQVAFFVESLRRRGRFPPVFDHWGVAEFMQRLADLDPSASCASSASFASSASLETQEAREEEVAKEKATPPSLLAWFQDFLTRLPAVIDFREFSAVPAASSAHGSRATGHGSRLVSFTEPPRGMTVDPASIELAERAESLAAELGISYADALTQLRQEHRHSPTTA